MNLNLTTHLVHNSIYKSIKLNPSYSTLKRDKYQIEMLYTYSCDFLETIIKSSSKDKHKLIYDSYKILLKKIIINLNILGYNTDSSGIDQYEIRIIPKPSKRFWVPDSEIGTGYILYEILSWYYNMKYSDLIHTADYDDVEEIFVSNRNIGEYISAYSVKFSDIKGAKFLKEIGYSKEYSKKILKDIADDIDQKYKYCNISWNDTFDGVVSHFNNSEQKQNFESYCIEKYRKFYIDQMIKSDFIQMWFSNNIDVPVGHQILSIRPKLYTDGENYNISFIKLAYVNNNPIEFHKVLSDISNIEFTNIIENHFEFDGVKFSIDSDVIEGKEYWLKLSKIRVEIYNMMLDWFKQSAKNYITKLNSTNNCSNLNI